jgi:hypothetical protein
MSETPEIIPAESVEVDVDPVEVDANPYANLHGNADY